MKHRITFACLIYLLSTIGINCLYSQDVYTFYYKTTRYEIVQNVITWTDAASYAVSNGGYLAQIDSKEEQDTIYNAIIKGAKISPTYTTVTDGGGVAYIWIGGTDKMVEGQWIWDGNNDNHGELFWTGQGIGGNNNGKIIDNNYVNWGRTPAQVYVEPDNYGGSQDCAAIALEAWPKGVGSNGSAGQWNDIKISNRCYYVVEYDYKIDPPKLTKPDSNSFNIETMTTFRWRKVIAADTFHIQISQYSDFSVIDYEKSGLTDTNFTLDFDLFLDTKYYWRVKSLQSGLESVWSPVWYFITTEKVAVITPKAISPENNSLIDLQKPLFYWTRTNGLFYQLILSKKSDFTSDIIYNKLDIADTFYTSETVLEKGVTYYWKVRAEKANYYSTWSDTWTFTIKGDPPAAPQLLLPEDNADNIDLKPLFKFTIVSKATKYNLNISKNSDLSQPAIDTTIDTDGSIDNIKLNKELEKNTFYYWAMKSMNPNGESPLSGIRKFHTTNQSGINDNLSDLMFYIFPNPAIDWINIQGFTGEAVITDLQGNLLWKGLINDQRRLDLNEFPSGLYFIKFGTKSACFVKY
jgi:hypothetical protein